MFQTGFSATLVPALAAAAALTAAVPARSADLGPGVEYGARTDGAYGLERPPGPPAYEPRYGRSVERRAEVGECRVVVRRRVNEFGEEIIRRARICEEQPVAYGRPRPPLDADEYGAGSPEPVPPADIPDEEGTLR